MRATQDPGMRLIASLAMAESDDDSGRAVLANVVDAVPAGHELWRRAAGGLAKLGDANARKLLEGELAQSDAVRSVGAAESLARADDARAREVLARVVADKALRGVVTRHWRLRGSATGVCSNGPATDSRALTPGPHALARGSMARSSRAQPPTPARSRRSRSTIRISVFA